jgi:Uncharacterized protein conserved in bacteria (DUF2130)
MHNGRKCGTIIYESKNQKEFRYEHVAKLREDQLAAKAEHAILSTHKFPVGTRQLDMQDGVVLANPARVLFVAALFRDGLLRLHRLGLSSAERESKKRLSMRSLRRSAAPSSLAVSMRMLRHSLRSKSTNRSGTRKPGRSKGRRSAQFKRPKPNCATKSIALSARRRTTKWPRKI